jgi:hypothetical protein
MNYLIGQAKISIDARWDSIREVMPELVIETCKISVSNCWSKRSCMFTRRVQHWEHDSLDNACFQSQIRLQLVWEYVRLGMKVDGNGEIASISGSFSTCLLTTWACWTTWAWCSDSAAWCLSVLTSHGVAQRPTAAWQLTCGLVWAGAYSWHQHSHAVSTRCNILHERGFFSMAPFQAKTYFCVHRGKYISTQNLHNPHRGDDFIYNKVVSDKFDDFNQCNENIHSHCIRFSNGGKDVRIAAC